MYQDPRGHEHRTTTACRAAPDITIRSFRERDVDFVISRQLALYESEYGFTSEIWKTYLTEGYTILYTGLTTPGTVCIFLNIMAFPRAVLLLPM